MLSGYLIIESLGSSCLVNSRVAVPQAALGLVSMMLQCVIVNCSAYLDLIRML